MRTTGNIAWRVALGAAGSAIAVYGARKLLARRAALVEAEHVVNIRKSAAELAALWRRFEAPEGMVVIAVDFEENSRGTAVRAVVHGGHLELKEHLRRFKQLAEAGEIATNESPSARKKRKPEPGSKIKPVVEAVETVKAARKRKKRSNKKPAERSLP